MMLVLSTSNSKLSALLFWQRRRDAGGVRRVSRARPHAKAPSRHRRGDMVVSTADRAPRHEVCRGRHNPRSPLAPGPRLPMVAHRTARSGTAPATASDGFARTPGRRLSCRISRWVDSRGRNLPLPAGLAERQARVSRSLLAGCARRSRAARAIAGIPEILRSGCENHALRRRAELQTAAVEARNPLARQAGDRSQARGGRTIVSQLSPGVPRGLLRRGGTQ